jgi:hypothetical protein
MKLCWTNISKQRHGQEPNLQMLPYKNYLPFLAALTDHEAAYLIRIAVFRKEL